MAGGNKKNSEGYPDQTAYAAMKNIAREEERYRRLRKIIMNICDIAGFEVHGHIVLMDRSTGRIWK